MKMRAALRKSLRARVKTAAAQAALTQPTAQTIPARLQTTALSPQLTIPARLQMTAPSLQLMIPVRLQMTAPSLQLTIPARPLTTALSLQLTIPARPQMTALSLQLTIPVRPQTTALSPQLMIPASLRVRVKTAAIQAKLTLPTPQTALRTVVTQTATIQPILLTARTAPTAVMQAVRTIMIPRLRTARAPARLILPTLQTRALTAATQATPILLIQRPMTLRALPILRPSRPTAGPITLTAIRSRLMTIPQVPLTPAQVWQHRQASQQLQQQLQLSLLRKRKTNKQNT